MFNNTVLKCSVPSIKIFDKIKNIEKCEKKLEKRVNSYLILKFKQKITNLHLLFSWLEK